MIIAVYVTPEAEGVTQSVSLEIVGGPKRFARVFASDPSRVEWGWVLHESAVKVWGEEEQ